MELIEALKTYTYVYETDEFTQFAQALISHGEFRLKLIVTRSCGKKTFDCTKSTIAAKECSIKTVTSSEILPDFLCI